MFDYWLEKLLDQNGIHMTDIPSEVFKKIPIDYLTYCHCNSLLFHRKSSFMEKRGEPCLDCNGTTWRFSQFAEERGYRWQNITNLSLEQLNELSCEYFERCPCSDDEQGMKPPEKRKIIQNISDLIKIPRLGFNPFI